MSAQPENQWTSRAWTRAVMAALALYQVVAMARYLVTHNRGDNPLPLFADFYAFWSFGRFVDVTPAEQIYAAKALEAFQHALLPGFNLFYPCSYPPTVLLFLAPLGTLGYLPAFAVWTAVGVVGFALAVGAVHDRGLLPWLAVLAPTTVLTIIFGQNGLITSALLIGGFRIMERRPWLAGVLLGLLSFKPQLFVLLPLVLLVGRRWRSLAAMAGTVSVLVGLSLLVYGLAAWRAWLEVLPGFARTLDREWHLLGWQMPTVTASLRSAGASPLVFTTAQLAVAAIVIVVLLALFHRSRRRPAPTALDAAALQVGIFLTTPYAFIYDMPMVSAATVTLAAARMAPGQAWRPGERVVALTGFCLPMIMFSEVFKTLPIGPITLIALFAVTARAAWGGRTDALP